MISYVKVPEGMTPMIPKGTEAVVTPSGLKAVRVKGLISRLLARIFKRKR